MVTRKTRSGLKNGQIGQSIKHCFDCKHSYGWHEIGFNGKPFLCHCPFYKQGKFSKFLNDKACEHFQNA